MEKKEFNEDEKNKEEYAKLFTSFFDFNISKKDFSKLPMLQFILDKFYNDFEEPTKDIKELRDKTYEVYEKLTNDFTQEQKILMQKYQELESDTEYKEKEKIFVMGFLIGSKLSKELEI